MTAQSHWKWCVTKRRTTSTDSKMSWKIEIRENGGEKSSLSITRVRDWTLSYCLVLYVLRMFNNGQQMMCLNVDCLWEWRVMPHERWMIFRKLSLLVLSKHSDQAGMTIQSVTKAFFYNSTVSKLTRFMLFKRYNRRGLVTHCLMSSVSISLTLIRRMWTHTKLFSSHQNHPSTVIHPSHEHRHSDDNVNNISSSPQMLTEKL